MYDAPGWARSDARQVARLSKRKRPYEKSYHNAILWKHVLGETEGVYGDVLLDDKQLKSFMDHEVSREHESLLARIHREKKKIPGSTGIVGFF